MLRFPKLASPTFNRTRSLRLHPSWIDIPHHERRLRITKNLVQWLNNARREPRNPSREGKPPTRQSKGVVPLMDALLREESVQLQDSCVTKLSRAAPMKIALRLFHVFVILFYLLDDQASAQVGTNYIFAPESVVFLEGNTNQRPMDFGIPQRFQQVYDSSLFAVHSNGVEVYEFLFRADGELGRLFSTTVSNIEVHLSTTLKTVNSLSPVFDENIGVDNKMVIGRAPFRLFGDGDGSGARQSWSVDFYFPSNSFRYNPVVGNLLLDIRVYNGVRTTVFDAVDRSGDSVASVFGFGASIPASGQVTSVGLATVFFFNPVPEPSSAATLIFGLVCLALALKRGSNARPVLKTPTAFRQLKPPSPKD
jgi:hypothetical protein